MSHPRNAIPKRQLARMVIQDLDARGVTRDEAARLVGDSPTQMSRLYQGHLKEFSSERLIRMLTRLGHQVRIQVLPPIEGQKRGKVRVTREEAA